MYHVPSTIAAEIDDGDWVGTGDRIFGGTKGKPLTHVEKMLSNALNSLIQGENQYACEAGRHCVGIWK